jgi:nucleoside-diphosphate-sugar epimerase
MISANKRPGKRILVTGASGLIGRHTVSMMMDKGFKVYGTLRAGENPPFVGPAWFVGNLLDPAFRASIVERARASHLLHLAWHMDNIHSEHNMAWVEASTDLFQRFRNAGGRRIVAAGSCAEYGDHEGNCDEIATPMNPRSPYARAKCATFKALGEIADQSMSAVWGRAFFTYGPYENPRRLVPHVVNSLLNSKPARCSHGEQVRDFLHVHDVASAFTSLVDSDIVGAINIASGTAVAIKEVVTAIGRKLGRAALIKFGAIEPGLHEPKQILANTGRLRTELNWTPKFDLDSGLDHTIEWWTQRVRSIKSG